MIRIQKILYPTDFSSYSNQAYFHAVTLSGARGAGLTVLFVHTPDFASRDEAGKGPNYHQYWRNQLEQIRPVNPKIPVQHVFAKGDPATEIVRHARDAGIDVIVM